LKRKMKESLLIGLSIIMLTYILEFRLLQLAQVPIISEEQKPSNLIVIFGANMTDIHWMIIPSENVTIPDSLIHNFPDVP